LSWQQELRWLDGELAVGRISSDEYHARRDTLLSSVLQPVHTTGQSETTQVIPAVPGHPDWHDAPPQPAAWTGRQPAGVARKPLLIAAAITLVVALGVASFLIFGQGDGAQAGPATSAPQASTGAQRQKDDLEIARLPGTAGEKPEFKTFADVAKAGLLTDRENTVYQAANAGRCRLVTSGLPDGVTALVLTVETSDAKTATAALVRLQGDFGMKPYTGTAPAGVAVTQVEGKTGPAAIRGHYAFGTTVVRVQASGPSLAQISKAFDEILAGQLDSLPVND
jgi:hypothetical protein